MRGMDVRGYSGACVGMAVGVCGGCLVYCVWPSCVQCLCVTDLSNPCTENRP